MAKKHYVAYVGTYTTGTSKGIHIYDVDLAEGLLSLRKVVPVNNSSYVILSRNGRYLYSIADEGVAVFKILADGDLERINQVGIEGMRGCHLSTDLSGRYLFVGGYHDGKVTVVYTHEDGRLGDVMDGVFHRGSGALTERSFRPHVCCVRITPDSRFLLAVDSGTDQIVVYSIDADRGKLKQVDVLRMGAAVGPRSVHFSRDGKVMYVLCELSLKVRVYTYDGSGRFPEFELIQEISTIADERDPYDAACAMRLSYDGKYLFATTTEDNSVAMYRVLPDDTLERLFVLPISGAYPKDAAFFPDEKHIAVVNNASNSITTFSVDYEKRTLIMKGRPQSIDMPNCIVFCETKTAPDDLQHGTDGQEQSGS